MQWIATLVCWGLVTASWIAGAVVGLRRAPAHRQPYGNGALWRVGAIVLVGLAYWLTRHDLRRIAVHSSWIEIPGLVLLIASTIFTLWARVALGAMWAISPNVLQDVHELRSGGPYAVTRHPIYTGLLGMLLGSVLLAGLGASIVFPLAWVAVVGTRVPVEERIMSETFPADYERYRRRVPQLVPGLRLVRRPRQKER